MVRHNNDVRNVRCANRNRNTPDNWNNNIGFRVVSHDSQNETGKARRLWTRDGVSYMSQRGAFPANVVRAMCFVTRATSQIWKLFAPLGKRACAQNWGKPTSTRTT